MTLVEAALTLTLTSLVLGGMVYAVQATQLASAENELTSRVAERAHYAMDRVVSMVSQALSTDAEFTPLFPAIAGAEAHCLRFRFPAGIVGGVTTYNDEQKVFVWGPDDGPPACAGLIIGRGRDLFEIHESGAGADAVLGTQDDVTSATVGGDVAVVEVLIIDNYAPRSGDMFTIVVNGPAITITLRLNAKRRTGDFVFNEDIVITERVALLR